MDNHKSAYDFRIADGIYVLHGLASDTDIKEVAEDWQAEHRKD